MNDQTPPVSNGEAPEAALPTISSTGGREGKFRAHDGTVIRYAWWRGDKQREGGTLVYFNGRTEFIEKNLETVGDLVARGFDVWTLDWRGQGLSQRALGNRHKGHIEDYRQHLGDLRLFFRDYVESKPRERTVLLGHSMGCHIALRALHELSNSFTHVVLASPLIDIHGGNVLVRAGLRLLAGLGTWPGLARAYLPGSGDYGPKNRRFEGNLLSSDPQRFARMHDYIDANPDLALGGPTLGWLNATRRSTVIISNPAFAAALATPILIVSAGADRVVSNPAQQALAARLPQGRIETVEDARHEILLEQDLYRNQFWRLFDSFVLGIEEEEIAPDGPVEPTEPAAPPASESSA